MDTDNTTRTAGGRERPQRRQPGRFGTDLPQGGGRFSGDTFKEDELATAESLVMRAEKAGREARALATQAADIVESSSLNPGSEQFQANFEKFLKRANTAMGRLRELDGTIKARVDIIKQVFDRKGVQDEGAVRALALYKSASKTLKSAEMLLTKNMKMLQRSAFAPNTFPEGLAESRAAEIAQLGQDGRGAGKFRYWDDAAQRMHGIVVPTNATTNARFGDTWGTANAQQRENRITQGYTGRGTYEGRGDLDMPGFTGDEDGYDGRGGYLGKMIGSRFGVGEGLSAVENAIVRGATSAAQQALRGRGSLGDHAAEAIGLMGGAYTGSGAYEAVPPPPVVEKRSRVDDGDYWKMAYPTMQENNIMNPDTNAPFALNRARPRGGFNPTAEGGMTFAFHEYIGDVRVSEQRDFQTLMLLPINAGLAQTFPVLSRFASMYTQYEFKQLVIRYRPLANTGNNVTGQVLVGTEYNVTSSPSTSKREMETQAYVGTARVVDGLRVGIECDPKKNVGSNGEYYVRTADLSSTDPPARYDMAYVQVAVADATPNMTLGEIWVEYVVELNKFDSRSTANALNIGEGVGLTLVSNRCAGVVAERQVWGVDMYGPYGIDATANAAATSMPEGSQFPLPGWTNYTEIQGQELGSPGAVYLLANEKPTLLNGASQVAPDFCLRITDYIQSPKVRFGALSSDGNQETMTIKFQTSPGATYAFTFAYSVSAAMFLSAWHYMVGAVNGWNALQNSIDHTGQQSAVPQGGPVTVVAPLDWVGLSSWGMINNTLPYPDTQPTPPADAHPFDPFTNTKYHPGSTPNAPYNQPFDNFGQLVFAVKAGSGLRMKNPSGTVPFGALTMGTVYEAIRGGLRAMDNANLSYEGQSGIKTLRAAMLFSSTGNGASQAEITVKCNFNDGTDDGAASSAAIGESAVHNPGGYKLGPSDVFGAGSSSFFFNSLYCITHVSWSFKRVQEASANWSNAHYNSGGVSFLL